MELPTLTQIGEFAALLATLFALYKGWVAWVKETSYGKTKAENLTKRIEKLEDEIEVARKERTRLYHELEDTESKLDKLIFEILPKL